MRSISGETDADLDAVMAGAPDAILLPGSLGAASVQQLSAKLAVREADFGLADGATRIIAVADTAQSLFDMGSYRGSSARLIGIAWSAELPARRYRRRDATAIHPAITLGPYRLARDLTLLAAASAGVAAIDAAFADIGDAGGPARRGGSPRGATGLPAKWRSTRRKRASSTTSFAPQTPRLAGR